MAGMRMFYILLKKSICNWRMLISVSICFIVLCMPLASTGSLNVIFGTQQPASDILNMYTVPFAFSSFVIFAGLFPGLPYAYSYLEERNCGYIKFIQMRMSRKRYVGQKIFFTGLSGGAMMLFTTVLIYIVLDLISLETTPENYTQIFEILIWGPYMFIWGGRFVLMLKAILMILFGVLWSELALAISLLVHNKYVAFILPFIIFEALWIIFKGSIFNPIYLIRADFENNVWVGAPYLVLCLYIAIMLVINVWLFRKQERR